MQDRNEKSNEKWTFTDKDEVKEFYQESSLFPHDFIELLFPPSNYIGAKHFFETRLDDVNKIGDYCNKICYCPFILNSLLYFDY